MTENVRQQKTTSADTLNKTHSTEDTKIAFTEMNLVSANTAQWMLLWICLIAEGERMSKGFIYSTQQEMFSKREIIGFGDETFYIEEIERNKANKIIVKNHYSHKYYNATYIHLGVFIEKELVGVLQYGYAMNPASGSSVVKDTQIDEYLELNRMWLDDKAPRNSESKAISYSIKYIHGKFPKVKWIQSFADERCGRFGVVYQAANFGFYGEHTAIFWTVGNEVFHNSLMTRNPKLRKSAAYIQANKELATSTQLRQFRYLYFIDSREKKNCLLKQQPYPKHYKEVA